MFLRTRNHLIKGRTAHYHQNQQDKFRLDRRFCRVHDRVVSDGVYRYAKWLATWLARAAICLSLRPRRQDYTRLQWKARHAAHGQQVRRYPLSCHATTDPLSCRGAGAKLRKLTQSFYERLQDPRFYGVDPDKLFRVKVKCKFWHITDVADGLFRWETGIRHLIRHGHGHGRNGGGDGIYGADSDGNCNVPLDGCESEGTFNGCESESE